MPFSCKDLLCFLALGTVLPLAAGPSLRTLDTTPAYSWDYWSYGIGAGIGLIHGQYATSQKSDSADIQSDIRLKNFAYPIPDLRLSLEKSWIIAPHVTATLDLSLLTPAVTIGYLLSERTRIYCGVCYPVSVNHQRLNYENTVSTTKRDEAGNLVTDKRILCSIACKNAFGLITPLAGLDTFIAPRTLLRIGLSYDWGRLYDTINKRPVDGSIHWPQVTVTLKKFF